MKLYPFLEKEGTLFLERVKKVSERDRPDLFVLFLPPIAYLNKDFFKYLKTALPYSRYITVSTVGVMLDDRIGYDYFGGFGVKFEKRGFFEIYVIENFSKMELDDTHKTLRGFLTEDKNSTYLMFTTASNVYINKLLNEIFKRQEFPRVRLYGGVASSNLKDFTTFLSCEDKILEDCIIIIRLGNVISYNTVSFGFIPVGSTYRITRAKENHIFEIDGLSSEYFLTNLLNNTGLKPENLDYETTSQVLWEFPLLVIDEEKEYIKSIRTFKSFNVDSKSLEFFGLVEEGSLIKLSTGDSEDILRDVDIRGQEFYNIIQYANRKPDFVMNISCTARNYLLLSDGKGAEEQRVYKTYLQKFKIVGFLTFGEIGPDRFGKPGEFFNETSILVGLEEIYGL